MRSCNNCGCPEELHYLWENGVRGECHNRRNCPCLKFVPPKPDTVAPIPDDLKAGRLQDYWRCFHCDFATTNFRDAYAHFGDRDDAEEFKPICKWWANMEPAERQETFQGVVRELNDVKVDNDNLVERLNQIEAQATEYASQRNEKTRALAQAEQRAAKAEAELESANDFSLDKRPSSRTFSQAEAENTWLRKSLRKICEALAQPASTESEKESK